MYQAKLKYLVLYNTNTKVFFTWEYKMVSSCIFSSMFWSNFSIRCLALNNFSSDFESPISFRSISFSFIIRLHKCVSSPRIKKYEEILRKGFKKKVVNVLLCPNFIWTSWNKTMFFDKMRRPKNKYGLKQLIILPCKGICAG